MLSKQHLHLKHAAATCRAEAVHRTAKKAKSNEKHKVSVANWSPEEKAVSRSAPPVDAAPCPHHHLYAIASREWSLGRRQGQLPFKQ
jgi:hypothetical protein